METDKNDILSRLQDGDPDALCLIYIQYAGKIRDFAFRLLRNATDAEDVAHDVFLRIWEYRGNLGKVQSLPDYLFMMTRNAIFNIFKRRLLHRKMVDAHNEGNTHEFNDEDKVFSNHLLQLIDQEISKMTSQRRRIFYLSRYKRMSYNEIAELLDISPRTVQYHISRTLAVLRKLLDDYNTSPRGVE